MFLRGQTVQDLEKGLETLLGGVFEIDPYYHGENGPPIAKETLQGFSQMIHARPTHERLQYPRESQWGAIVWVRIAVQSSVPKRVANGWL